MSPEDLEDYLSCLEAEDLPGAVSIATGLLDEGCPIPEIVGGIFALAQAEVGRRWESHAWSIGHEHIATSITDAALAAVAERMEVTGGAPDVLVVCVEGEWHSLPARMFTTLLQCAGWAPRFLGASLPADDLSYYLADRRPEAVLASCSLSSFLPGAAATVAAVHRAGLPVMAGGSGFGTTGAWARAIGADAWAPDAGAADEILRRWLAEGPPQPLGRALRDAGEIRPASLAARRTAVADAAVSTLVDALPSLRGMDAREHAGLRSDMDHLHRCVEAALYVDDSSVLVGQLQWLGRRLEVAATASEAVAAVAAALGAALGYLEDGPEQDAARSVLATGVAMTADPTLAEAGSGHGTR